MVQRKQVGPMCMYGGGHCPPPAWKVRNQAGAIVSYLCADHKKSTWAATPHTGLTCVPVNDKEVKDAMGTTSPPSGRLTNSDDSRAAEEAAGDRGEGAAPGELGGGRELVYDRAPESARPAKTRAPAAETPPAQPPSGGLVPLLEPTSQAALPQPFDAKTVAILAEEIPPEWYEIRPDTGAVYLPHVFIRQILIRAFGRGGSWLLPRGDYRITGREVTWVFDFITATGWRTVVPGHHIENRSQIVSLGDALESARSDALTRVAKDLGIALELWVPGVALAWQGKWAVRVWIERDHKWCWRRKDRPALPGEGRPGREPESEYDHPADFADDAREHIDAIARGRR